MTAMDSIDAAIAELEAKLKALKMARSIIQGGAPRTNGVHCDVDDDCKGPLHSTTCADCGHTAARCKRHGGQRASGGTIAAHRRFECTEGS